MKKFVPLILATMVGGVFSTSAIAADPQATVVWNGFVGSSIAGDKLVITGAGGVELNDANTRGTLFVNNDGTFTSSELTLEARSNDWKTGDTGNAIDNPVIGALKDADWKVTKVEYMLGGNIVQSITPKVTDTLSSTDFTVGGTGVAKKQTLSLRVSNATPITKTTDPNVNVEGAASVAVTVVASEVVTATP